jgi:anti-sigma factor RsiW
MNCDEYRKQQILAEGEQHLPAEVRQHFAECADCQTHLLEQERLRSQLRKLAESEHAPQTLRRSVAVLFRLPRVPKRRSRGQWGSAAAAILLSVGAGIAFSWYQHARQPSPERLAQEFIADHLHYLPGREQVVSDSPPQVASWFQGRVEFPVRVPEVPGATLQDARVCDISGRKAALLHYRHKPDGALISFFIAEEPKAFGLHKEPVELVTSVQGLNSTLWCHRGLVYDVVAALDDSSLQQIAASVRKQEP